MQPRLSGRPRLLRYLPALLLAAAPAAPCVTPASAQTTKVKAATPTPPDTRPLARFIPRDNLVVYAETDGLDAHADAWKKTSAYKMLNDTSLGEVLEAMAAQLADRALAANPNRKVNGAEVVALGKMLAQRGFAFGLNVDPKGDRPVHATLVVRSAAAREYKAAFSRSMGMLMGSTKPQLVKKEGRAVANVGDKGHTWAWWAEPGENDVVFAIASADDADLVIETANKKRPSAADHPVRVELAKADNGFEPAGLFFVDPAACPDGAGGQLSEACKWVRQEAGVSRVDFRWGYQDDALMSVTRLKAPKPRKGLLALFDGPTLDKAKLPPLPEAIETFAAFSVDPAKLFDVLQSSGPPPLKKHLDDLADAVKAKTRRDLRKDILGHLGPKAAVYVAPGGAAAKSGDAEKGENAEAPAANPIAGLTGVAAAVRQIPRLTLVADIDDPVRFNKTLDDVMIGVNKAIRERAQDAAETAEKAAEASNRNANRPGGPGGGDQAKSRRRAPLVYPEFQAVESKDPDRERVFVMKVPPALTRTYPPGLRPSIRVAGKHVAVSVAADAARLALEPKDGAWTPPSDFSAGFDQVPAGLVVLQVADPRPHDPEVLAGLPGLLQRTANAVIEAGRAKAAGPAAGGGPGGAPGGGPGRPSVSAAMQPGGGGQPGPGPGGPGGPGGGAPADGPAPIQFNIDADKLPKADELRSLMFPGFFAASADDQEVRFTTRAAFPSTGSVGGAAVGTALILPAVQAARAAARRAGLELPDPAKAQAAPSGGPAAGNAPAGNAPTSSPPGGPGGRPRGPGGPGGGRPQ